MAKRQPAAPPLEQQPRQKRPPPEKKFAVGGIGVAVWLNTIESDDGPKSFRSVTIAPRRYQDKQSGEWKDSTSFNPGDLPALIFVLTKVQEFVFTVPLPGQEPEHAAGHNGDGELDKDGLPF